MSFEDFKAAMREYHAEQERKKRPVEQKPRLAVQVEVPPLALPAEDYTGSICLLHTLTPMNPVYQEILVDADDLESLIKYKWRIDRIGGRSRRKYVVGHGCGKYSLHLARIILNARKGMFADHINHRPLDNRRKNLREVTNRQNNINSLRQVNGSSQYRGVYRCRSKWYAQAGMRGCRVFLGSFDNEVDAARAYNEFAKNAYGSIACLNQV